VLTIYEELLLIAIDDDKGNITTSADGRIEFGLAGALLAELALQGKLQLVKKKLSLLDSNPTGDEILDELLTKISEERPRKAPSWISSLGNKKLVKRIAGQLATKGIIRIEAKRYLWVIPYEVYPQQNASAKYWVKQQLRSVVMADEQPEQRSVALLSLLKACDLLNLVFTKDERKAARRRVKVLVQGEEFGEAVAQTIEEIEAAMIAVIVAVSSSV
jgi:Golgi phosphoprotein 3